MNLEHWRYFWGIAAGFGAYFYTGRASAYWLVTGAILSIGHAIRLGRMGNE